MDTASSKIQYLNTDLELESENDVTAIVEAFGEDVIVLHHGMARALHHAAFGIAGSHAGPDEDIRYFCTRVEALPPEARTVWNGCCTRVFDIGYKSGNGSPAYRSELRSGTVRAVSAIGASIVVTVYPVGPDAI